MTESWAEDDNLKYETLKVGKEGAVLFVEIAAPPMSLLGPELVAVKERVNAIALAPSEDFRRDSDLFGEGVRKREAQSRLQAALKRGFQTRDAEMDLGQLLGDLAVQDGEIEH